jgi:hypothetical protein
MKVWTAAQLQAFLDGSKASAWHRPSCSPPTPACAAARDRRGGGPTSTSAKLIHVRQAAIAVNYKLRLSDVKTAHARRTIDVNDDVVRALTAWRRAQAKERLLLGVDYADLDLVLAVPTADPRTPR